MGVGAIEQVAPLQSVSGPTILTIEGSNEAYSEIGFILLVSQVTGAWDVEFKYGANGLSFNVATVSGITGPGPIFLSKINALVNRELPIPRPTRIVLTPTSPGSITFRAFILWA